MRHYGLGAECDNSKAERLSSRKSHRRAPEDFVHASSARGAATEHNLRKTFVCELFGKEQQKKLIKGARSGGESKILIKNFLSMERSSALRGSLKWIKASEESFSSFDSAKLIVSREGIVALGTRVV
jgi:hypothetical protein